MQQRIIIWQLKKEKKKDKKKNIKSLKRKKEMKMICLER